ncbi:hypothetical protein [Microcoleus anatoxicus]|uniref:Uncharacterized protein n=1 Tax=Microcoleus anatoxicus PTRS2 TaxID=2705321 RepID=A0ABU8YIB2_9CYAN
MSKSCQDLAGLPSKQQLYEAVGLGVRKPPRNLGVLEEKDSPTFKSKVTPVLMRHG